MAIIIEGEKQSNGLVQITVAGIIVVIIIAVTYWVFFTEPPFVEVFAPQELENISRISQVETDPSVIADSPAFKALQVHVEEPQLGEFGRENPFARF